MIHSGSTQLAGVIGWPVAHSRSPRLHGYWLEANGIDGAYLPLPVAPENIEKAIRGLPALGFAGANVTVPHKEAAFGLMDRVSETAKRMGAVNTISVEADGALYGDNTDAFGFIENLKAGARMWDRGRPALVLGAGGAARAICVGLKDADIPTIYLVNRTRARADALAEDLDLGIQVRDWDQKDDLLGEIGLLVNTTSLGMTGKPPLDLDLEPLPTDAVVTDIVYVPLKTPLLITAEQRGNPVVDGLGMLLHQARPGFRSWFGAEPEVTPELRAFVGADLL